MEAKFFICLPKKFGSFLTKIFADSKAYRNEAGTEIFKGDADHFKNILDGNKGN